MQDNRPAVYVEGDNVIYRASALGHCLRSLWAARNGMDRQPIPEIIQRGMDEGTKLEPVILNLLYEQHGWGYAYGQQGQQFQVELNVGAFNGKTLIVRGKFDELGAPEPLFPAPIDVKAFTESDVQDWRNGKLTRYDWQLSVYYHGYGNTPYVFMPIFHKGTWQMVEESLKPIETVKYTREDIRDRVLQVEEAFYSGTMPEDCNGDFACPYPYLHDPKIANELSEAPALTARARIWLTQRIDKLTATRKTLDEKLLADLANGKFTLDGWTISLLDNPKRFNTDAAKQLLTEAEIDWQNDPVYWIPGEGRQVRFTKPKKGNDANRRGNQTGTGQGT